MGQKLQYRDATPCKGFAKAAALHTPTKRSQLPAALAAQPHRLDTACPILTKAGPRSVRVCRSLSARTSVSCCWLAPRLVTRPSISQLPSAAAICSVRVATATGRCCQWAALASGVYTVKGSSSSGTLDAVASVFSDWRCVLLPPRCCRDSTRLRCATHVAGGRQTAVACRVRGAEVHKVDDCIGKSAHQALPTSRTFSIPECRPCLSAASQTARNESKK